MLSLFITWLISFAILFLLGLLFVETWNIFSRGRVKIAFQEVYLVGFLVVSILSSYLSIVIPLNTSVLLIVSGIAFETAIFYWEKVKEYLSKIKTLSRFDLLFLSGVTFVIVAYSSSEIIVFDTGLYHAQAVRWLREYPVVPGAGNLHDRLAFNSLFFPISAIFTFDIPSIYGSFSFLSYPLNAVSFLVFFFWLYFLIKKDLLTKNWKNLFLHLPIALLCLRFLCRSYNSLSPDLICTLLVIYVFHFLISHKQKIESRETTIFQKTLIVITVFVCISFKLSSLFLAPTVLFFLERKSFLKPFGGISLIAIGVITPFLIRNYYLSGYLLFPFPSIDIFSVDWKIPLEQVKEAAWAISSWARIPKMPHTEVLKMPLFEWLPIWFPAQHILIQTLLCGILLLLPLMSVFFYVKKQNKLLLINIILLLNFIFWFISAPDPRFILGFLVFGFAFLLSRFTEVLTNKRLSNIFLTGCSIWVLAATSNIAYKHYQRASITFRNPFNLVFPNSMPTAKVATNKTNFIYFTPLKRGQCFNAPLPCTPSNKGKEMLILRKNTLKDGFKVIRASHNKEEKKLPLQK